MPCRDGNNFWQLTEHYIQSEGLAKTLEDERSFYKIAKAYIYGGDAERDEFALKHVPRYYTKSHFYRGYWEVFCKFYF